LYRIKKTTMNKEKQEQIKIALLSIIAVVLIIQTGMEFSSKSNTEDRVANVHDRGRQNTPVPANQGLRQPAVPVDAGQPSITIPANAGQPVTQSTTMVFDQKDVNIGTVKVGTKTSHTFKITNTGNQLLKFGNIRGNPGISVTSWTTEPILQGETGEIIVEFGDGLSVGSQKIMIHMDANTKPAHEHLTITANIVE